MVDRYRLGLLVLVVALGVALIANAGTTTGEPDPEVLVEKAVDSMENQSIDAIHTQRITRPGGEITQTVHVQQHRSAGQYIEVVGESGEIQQQLAFNDSVILQRNSNGELVQYAGPGEYLFDEFSTLGAAPEEVLENYDGDFEGTATVSGRESYVVSLSPPKETTAAVTLGIHAGNVNYELPLHEAKKTEWYLSEETWWIDKETFYPIKQTVTWTDKDEKTIATATREYEKLEVGFGTRDLPFTARLPSETELDSSAKDTVTGRNADSNKTNTPPETESDNTTKSADTEPDDTTGSANSKETDSSQRAVYEPTVFETRAGVNVSVPFQLPTLTMPSIYTFNRGIVQSHARNHSVMLLYSKNGTDETLAVEIVNSERSLFQYSLVIHSESVSGFDGEVVITNSGTEVVRECNGRTYRVRGPPDAETLIQVTESMQC
ncbi:hypothetical protein ACFQJ7_06855 [Halovenus rubra]|uniref:Uncharacterized protein n=2 Tax=Halovenus rubra TaxID=869890 RepID=A0ACC7DZM5_9EURY|nr:hypothetical protein [Halovenus rubra]